MKRPWRLLWRTPWREQGVRLKSLLGLSYALGITALLSSLRPNVPRYVLEAHFGQAELGMYAALAYFTALGGRVVQALGTGGEPPAGALPRGGGSAPLRPDARGLLGRSRAGGRVRDHRLGAVRALGADALLWRRLRAEARAVRLAHGGRRAGVRLREPPVRAHGGAAAEGAGGDADGLHGGGRAGELVVGALGGARGRGVGAGAGLARGAEL